MIKYINYLLVNIFTPVFIFKIRKRIGNKIHGDIDELWSY